MWISSVGSKEALIEAFKTRKSGKLYDNLYDAALSRSYADYFVGLTATEAMSLKFGGGNILNVGRVKTPTLRIIVDLEKQISDFKPTLFWKLTAKTKQNIDGNYYNQYLDDNRFYDKKEAEDVIKKIGIGPAKVTDVIIKKRKDSPKPLYNLSDLQIAMNRQYGFSANTVLEICQSLYEKHGLTTYPRTAENKISQSLANRQRDIINGLPSIFKTAKDEIVSERYVLNNKVVASSSDIGAHEALTPVPENISDDKINNLSDAELKVYVAIVERFLQNFYPDAVFESQEITFERNGEVFKNKVENLVYLGYYKVDSTFKSKEMQEFVKLRKDDYLDIKEVCLNEGQTLPPSRLTEGTLIKVMQNPKKYYNGSLEDKKILEETEGLGTEATRAGIIEELKKGGYIKVEKSKIYPTEKGINLIDIIPVENLKSVDLTVYFEKELSKIAKGNLDKGHFIDEINALNQKVVDEIKGKTGVEKTYQNSDSKKKVNELCKCPICSNSIVESKYGYYCLNKDCHVSVNFNSFERFGHKSVSKKEAKELLVLGITSRAVKLKSAKSGKEYEAFLTWQYDASNKYPNNCYIKFK